jgi:hypothetical protein
MTLAWPCQINGVHRAFIQLRAEYENRLPRAKRTGQPDSARLIFYETALHGAVHTRISRLC